MNNKYLTGIVGVGAFIIGGLLARQSAIEGIELLDEKIQSRFNPTPPPPPPAD